MTDAGADMRNLVERGLEGISLDAGEHAHSLLAAAKAALLKRDLPLAWLLADRLTRLIGNRQAVPLLLRSAALAALGKPAEARADVETAASIDPQHLLVGQILLRDPEAAKREQGARSLLAGGQDSPFFADALAVLARGRRAAALVRQTEHGIAASVWWRGAVRPALTVTDGVTHRPLTLPPARIAAGKTGFDHVADIHFGWPDHAPALAVEGPDDVFIEPAVVHRAGVLAGVLAGVPAGALPPAHGGGEASRLMVIVPVYDDAPATRACLDSLGPALPTDRIGRIVIVDDAGRSPQIRTLISEMEEDGRFILLKNALNLGFAASVNRALAMRSEHEDVLILNADTVLPRGAIDHLIATAQQDCRIGTVTPLSNNGEDTSAPKRFLPNPLPAADRIAAIDRLAWQANGTLAVDMPNGIGFCLFVKAAVIEAVGALPLDYGRGYYEDVAFCLKAGAAGYRNVCATGVYIGHAGARSFRGEKQGLIRRNLVRLTQAFPAYREAADDFEANDPVRPAALAIGKLDLGQATELRLVIVPSDCPLDFARGWAARLPTHARRSLLIQRAPGVKDPVSVSAIDGDFPQHLRLTQQDWRAFIVDAERRRAIDDVLLIDPASDPSEDITLLLGMNAHAGVVVGNVIVAGRAPPRWFPERIDLHAATPDLAEIAAAAGWPTPRSTIAGRPPRKAAAAPRPGRLLAIRAFRFDTDTLACLAALRSGIRKRGHDLGLALLGREDGDLALMEANRLWVSGEMSSDDIAGWVDFSGASALVILDRRYGLASPDCAAAAAAAIPFACFDPHPGGPCEWLRLDPFANADAIADEIIRWALIRLA